jgi:glycerol uptake facilitator-like aquaporin
MIKHIKHPYAIELLGTLFLSFTIFFTGNYLFIGLALALAIYIGGPISGGCFNPAITLVSYINNSLDTAHLFPYIIVQIIGAMLGFLIAKGFLSLINKKI